MAIHRGTEYCPVCGEPLKPIHANRGPGFVGDTFMGYEPCDHKSDSKEDKQNELEQGKNWERPTIFEIINNMRAKHFREECILEEVEKELNRLKNDKFLTPQTCQQGDGWIRVEDGFPKDCKEVYACNQYGKQFVLWYDGERWIEQVEAYHKSHKWPITHWRPTVAPPIK